MSHFRILWVNLIPISTLFNLHYSLYLTFVTFSYINILGFLSFIVFLSQLSSGILSSIYHNDFFTIASDPIIIKSLLRNLAWIPIPIPPILCMVVVR